MLIKEKRIKKRKEFEAIFKNSKSLRDNLFILKVAKNNLQISRFGFIVSQKVSKKAVVRNKVRRRLVATIKAEEKNIKEGNDLVFIALSGIEKKEFSEIKEAVNNALVKAGVFVKEN